MAKIVPTIVPRSHARRGLWPAVPLACVLTVTAAAARDTADLPALVVPDAALLESCPSLTTRALPVVAAADADGGQAGTTPTPARPAGQTEAIGEAPKERTAEDVFLRGQRVLLGRGQAVAEFGQFYSRSDTLQLASVDQRVGLATLEQGTLTTLLLGRIGIFDETELFASATYRRQDTRTFLGSTELARSGRNEFGDLGVGLRRTLLRESAGRPDVIATFDAQIPTGDTPYTIGGGLVLVKSVDPVVLFAGTNYHHSFKKNRATVTGLEPQSRFDVSVGYGLALNDTLAISTAVSSVFAGAATVDSAALRQSDTFSLRFALTSSLAKGLYIEPSVSVGLSGPGHRFALGVTIPYSF